MENSPSPVDNAQANSTQTNNTRASKPANSKTSLIIVSALAAIFLITTILFLILFINCSSKYDDCKEDLASANQRDSDADNLDEYDLDNPSGDSYDDYDNPTHGAGNEASAAKNAFTQAFLSSCSSSSSGQDDYCECSLDFLLDNGYVKEDYSGLNTDISSIQSELLETCGDKISN